MKIVKVISGILGLLLPLLIGRSFEISAGMFMVGILVFLLGIFSKVLMQTFEKPFLNISSNRQVPDHHNKKLNYLSGFVIFLGLGAFIGELVYFTNIGALPLTLLIFGISIHIGTHYINLEKWYFNQ